MRHIDITKIIGGTGQTGAYLYSQPTTLPEFLNSNSLFAAPELSR